MERGSAKWSISAAANSQARSCAVSRDGDAVRADAIAIARLTPMNASAETRLLGRAPNNASGVRENASAAAATSHSGEELALAEARAANT